ncbi:hypothetical protein G6F59_016535 [Rhizopus arrhizus]|nr:hypothetical protein G6F59_016535 [Rhizopus arrhizus]
MIEQQQPAQYQPGQRDLRRTGTEHRAPHHLQACRAEDAVGVLHEAQPVRAQHHAGRQVTQHRAKAELLEHRHGDDRRQQQYQRQFQTAAMHGNTWSSGKPAARPFGGGKAWRTPPRHYARRYVYARGHACGQRCRLALG